MPTTAQLQTAAVMRAQGASYMAVEEATGIPHSVAHRAFQKDELNQLVNQAQFNLIKNALGDAVNNQIAKIKAGAKIVNKISNSEDLPQGAIKLMELAHDNENRLLSSVGIHQANTQSIVFQQMNIDARSELSPAIERMLVSHLGGDVIEAEVGEVNGQADGNDGG